MNDFDFCKVASWSWNIYDRAFLRKWLMNESKKLIIFAKSSILDVLLGTELTCFLFFAPLFNYFP